jgi:hypothetical protein
VYGVPPNLPAGFIHAHHLAVAQLKNQIVVGRLQFLSQPRVRPDDGRAFDRQFKRAAQHPRGFAIRHTQAVFHLGRQTNGVRPNLNRGRAQRIRGLFRMTPLHSALAALTMPHVHIELGDHRGNGTRNIHLILHLHRVFDDAPSAIRTTRRQGRFFHMIHMVRRPAVGGTVACLLPWLLGPRLRRARGKGRGLALARPFGLVQLALQFREAFFLPLNGGGLLSMGCFQFSDACRLLSHHSFQLPDQSRLFVQRCILLSNALGLLPNDSIGLGQAQADRFRYHHYAEYANSVAKSIPFKSD